ncbi:MAG: tRNA (guanosine(37)-N1)-methyltransferase TrmD [Coriobacteriia bacterium]
MRIDVLTIFPEIFEGPLSASMLGLAQEKGVVEVAVHDLRDWTTDKHRQVDDAPYGGGPGMVMKPESFFRAVSDLKGEDTLVVLMTPQGRRLEQRLAEDLSSCEHLLILCGRYEGFDERVRVLADLEVSIGDYVLTGGELPALVMIDVVTRLLPGVLGCADSPEEESFSSGLLEYPQYTRPREWEGLRVPEVLLSGDHGRVAAWRREQALIRTAKHRPDLLEKVTLSEEERALTEGIIRATRDASAAEDTGPDPDAPSESAERS